MLCDWSRKFAPPSQPIRCKIKTNRDLVSRVFPRLRTVTCVYSEFSLAPSDVSFLLIGRYKALIRAAPCILKHTGIHRSLPCANKHIRTLLREILAISVNNLASFGNLYKSNDTFVYILEHKYPRENKGTDSVPLFSLEIS